MKRYTICVFAFVILALLFPNIALSSRNIAVGPSRHKARRSRTNIETKMTKITRPQPQSNNLYSSSTWDKLPKEIIGDMAMVHTAGSTLPDCLHACGPCSPCRLVMVSFVCASLAEAETCPMAYKCMCRNKSFPVP